MEDRLADAPEKLTTKLWSCPPPPPPTHSRQVCFVCVAVVGGADVTHGLDSGGEPQVSFKTCRDVSRPLMMPGRSGQVLAAATPTLLCVARACSFTFFFFFVFPNYVRFMQAWAVVPQDLSGMLLSVSSRFALRSHNVPSAVPQGNSLIAHCNARCTYSKRLYRFRAKPEQTSCGCSDSVEIGLFNHGAR